MHIPVLEFVCLEQIPVNHQPSKISCLSCPMQVNKAGRALGSLLESLSTVAQYAAEELDEPLWLRLQGG